VAPPLGKAFWRARHGTKKDSCMASDQNDSPQVIALPPVILAATLVVGFALGALWPLGLPAPDLARPSGLLFVLAAFTIAGLAVREMASNETPLDVRKSARTIVTSGIFSLSRNPIYLGMVPLALGIALVADSFWLLLLTPAFAAILRYGVILREETYLERKFGPDYLRYKARVRRWI
jgi:protein-S-isoprenylcysteine O-methyltransferase Ste14